jgi:hypothetical protein
MTRSEGKKKTAQCTAFATKKQDLVTVPSLLSLSAQVLRKNWTPQLSIDLGDYRKVVWNDWKCTIIGIDTVPADMLQHIETLLCSDLDRREISICNVSSHQRKQVHQLSQILRLDHKSCGEEPDRVLTVSVPQDWKWDFGPLSIDDHDREELQRKRKRVQKLEDDIMDLDLQFYFKFRGYGYRSSNAMVKGEPELFAQLEELKHEVEVMDM